MPGHCACIRSCIASARCPERCARADHELADEAPDQEGDVVAPLPQGWQINRQYVEAVEEVVAKFPDRDLLLERAIGGRHHPHVDLDRLHPAQPEERPGLQHPEQLDLHARRDLADLVEKDRAGVGQLEAAEPALRRPGKGPVSWPKIRSRQRSGTRQLRDERRPRRGESRESPSPPAPCRCPTRPGSGPCSTPAPSARS